jgi:predicted nucleic acid-binding protein
MDCILAGNLIRVPAIVYYETLRELERLNASAQIGRLKAFCFTDPDRFLALETIHLEEAAKLWGQIRNLGQPTASPDALDGDVILAAQTLSLGGTAPDLIVATTNVAHISRYVAADLWTNIQP